MKHLADRSVLPTLLAAAAVSWSACYVAPEPVGSRYVKSVRVNAQEGATLSVTAAESAALAGTTLVIEPGALSEDTTITIEPGLAPIVSGVDQLPAGPVAVFGPDGLTFSKPAKLTLPSSTAAGQQRASVFVQVQEGDGRRFTVPHGQLAIASSSVGLQINGFSSFQAGTTTESPCGSSTDLAVAMENLPPITSSSFYEARLAASGGVAPYHWTLLAGTLPRGLAFDPATGTVRGVPSLALTPSESALTVQVEDALGATATRDVYLRKAEWIQVLNQRLPEAIAGSEYHSELLATGGSGQGYTWNVLNQLPAGLQVMHGANSDPAVLMGTAPNAGVYPLILMATDNFSAATDMIRLTLRVREPGCAPDPGAIGCARDEDCSQGEQCANTFCAPGQCAAPNQLVVTTENLPPINPDQQSYYASLEASGGVEPFTWTLDSGTLPGGLQLSSATGIVGGTLNSNLQPGNTAITVRVTDSQGATATGIVNVRVVPDPFAITTDKLPQGVLGAEYLTDLAATMLDASQLHPPITWSIVDGTLPPGLTLSGFRDLTTGVISGMPSVTGCFPVTIQAQALDGTDSVRLNLRVRANECPELLCPGGGH